MILPRTMVALALAAGFAGPALAHGPAHPGPDNTGALESATRAFRRAIELAPTDAKASAGAALEAAAGFRGIAESGHVRNHRLQVNLGNAYLIAGDVGRAVLAYRRAELIRPDDSRAKAGLGAARARVGVAVEPDAEHRLLAWLLSWRAVVPRSALFWVFLAAYVAGWSVAATRLMGRGGRPGAFGVFLGLVALAAGGLLALDDYHAARSRDAVVVAPTVVGRNGPGESVYEASFKEPLRAGVECRVLEARGPWSRVRLSDGRETWLPASAYEEVAGR